MCWTGKVDNRVKKGSWRKIEQNKFIIKTDSLYGPSEPNFTNGFNAKLPCFNLRSEVLQLQDVALEKVGNIFDKK